jgi:GDP-4-dehydro-6-deoxy-D-mannose reductase
LRVLITGASGFVGQHLASYLHTIDQNITLFGTTLEPTPDSPIITYQPIDLRDYDAVRNLLAVSNPDHIYHLAAQAFVPRSFEDPWETLDNNIRSQLNIILACLELGIEPRMLVISSAEIYASHQSI